MACRFCGSTNRYVVVDLGFQPPSNSYLTLEDLSAPEITYPLKVFVCKSCWLMQTEDYNLPEQFFNSNYAYFSSTSKSWLNHSSFYVETVTQKLGLNGKSFVVEIASNDGYLLKNFVAKGIPCLGIEPTQSCAELSLKQDIPTETIFFNKDTASDIVMRHHKADLIIGNNVYAHVPDINSFTIGLKNLLSDEGVITLEFPHAMKLIQDLQYDTIYHEHFSYLSLKVVDQIFSKHGLRIFDVEELTTHGGSLRIWGCHDASTRRSKDTVKEIISKENEAGLFNLDTYVDFNTKVIHSRHTILKYLIECYDKNLRVAAYGAAAKGNTIFNYVGANKDLIQYAVDGAILKQNKFLPGSHIPVYEPSYLEQHPPDVIIIIPWNIKEEIRNEISSRVGHHAECVTLIPKVEKQTKGI